MCVGGHPERVEPGGRAGVGVPVRGESLKVARMGPRHSGFGSVIDYCTDEKAEQWQQQEPQREENSQIRRERR